MTEKQEARVMASALRADAEGASAPHQEQVTRGAGWQLPAGYEHEGARRECGKWTVYG